MSNQHAESAAAEPEEAPASGRWKTALKIVAALAVVAVLVLLGRQATPYVQQFTAWVEGLGALAPVVFILGYVVATVAFIPGSVLTLAAGAIFGLLWGTVYVLLGASLGACLAFLIARYLARGWVETKIEGKPKFQAVDRAVAREGGKIVALLRLTPVMPFNLLNYALGLTKVGFWPYALACLAMLPGTFLYVYLGYVAKTAAAGGGEAQTIGQWVMRIVGLAATVVVTILITKKAKKALDEQTELEVSDE